MKKLSKRLQDCGLEIHPDKSKIVYCKDGNRKEENDGIAFDFLGYTFRPRRCVDKNGRVHPNFLPAVSRASMKSINREVRSWHVQLKNEKELLDLAKMFNPKLRGWQLYYGRFYPSGLKSIWRNCNEYLVRWVRRKFKRFAKHKGRARTCLAQLASDSPNLFIHWRLGYRSSGSVVGAV